MLTKRQRLRKVAKRIFNRMTISSGTTVPVFIFGEMRSGTNMLANCFDRCRRTIVFHETDDEAFRDYMLHPLHQIKELVSNAAESHAIFKPIADSARAAEILNYFDASRGVWIYRHYNDVVNSAMRRWHEHNKYLHYVLNEPDKAQWRVLNLPPYLTELIRHHHARGISNVSARALIWYFRNEMYFHQDLHQNENVLLANYERLVADSGEQLSRAFDHVGLVFKPSYYGEVHSSSVGKDEPPVIDSDVQALCEDMLGRLTGHWNSCRPAMIA